MKIGNKISLSFLVVSVALTTLGVGINYAVVSNNMKEAISEHLTTAAQSRAHHVETYLEEHIGKAELLAGDPLLVNALKGIMDNSPEHV